jgi:ABC-type sugar transport system substrate-binding protein
VKTQKGEKDFIRNGQIKKKILEEKVKNKILLVCLILGLMVSCAPKEAAVETTEPTAETTVAEDAATTEEAAAPAADVKTVKVGISWNAKDNVIIQAWEDYMKEYAKQYGPTVNMQYEWVINVAEGDPARQVSNIQDLINQGVDVILVRAEDSASIGAGIQAALDAGIPIITFDRSSTSVKPTTHISQDAYYQAYSTGEAFAKYLKENNVEGKCIELLGDLRDQNGVLRSQAWGDAEKEFGAWKLWFRYQPNGNPSYTNPV